MSFKGGAVTINRKKNQAVRFCDWMLYAHDAAAAFLLEGTLLVQQVYGPEATPEAILGGLVPAPEEFVGLYQLLDELSRVAPVEVE